MDTIEQKEKDTIELRRLTKFQKKQVLSLVDRFLEENEESNKRGTPARKRRISGELICSLTVVSRDGAAFAEIHNMGKPSQEDVENIAHHFSSGTFFWTDGTNCYDRLVKEKGRGSKKLVTWESYDEYNHLNNMNSFHYKMEEREKKCHGVTDKYLPRYCALWEKVHSLSGMDLPDKVRSVHGLYEKRRDDKRPKTSNLKTLNVFDVAAS